MFELLSSAGGPGGLTPWWVLDGVAHGPGSDRSGSEDAVAACMPADPLAGFLDAVAGFEPPPGGPVVEGRDLAGLEDLCPGSGLAGVLDEIEPAGLSDGALVEVVAAAERLSSWALSVQVRAVAELTARAGGSSVAVDGVGAQVAARLCVTGRAAGLLVDLAAGLGGLPEVADALAAGRIDERRARVLVDGVVDVPRDQRRGLVAPLVGTAEAPGPACRLTGPRVRDRLRHRVAAHDPAGAQRRRQRVRAGRCVRFEPAGDAMAYLTALLPAADAARCRAHLEALAVPAHRARGEVRTLDQVRADTLVAVLTGARPVLTGVDGVGAGSRAGDGGGADAGAGGGSDAVGPVAWTAPTVRTVVHVTVAASTLLGLDEAPGELGGFGPIPAVLARELASASAPTSGTDVGAGDGACNGANRLCGDDVTWQRILTDPVTGIATDVSRRTYRPGVVLGDLVRARDATCTFPGCRVPAPRCDLDHVEPFDHGPGGGGSGGGGSGGGGIVSGGNGPGGRGTGVSTSLCKAWSWA